MRAQDGRRQDGDGDVHGAVRRPLRGAHRRRLHPRGVPGRVRPLRAGCRHPRRGTADAGHRRSLPRRTRAAGHGCHGGAAACGLDAFLPAADATRHAVAGLGLAADPAGRDDLHVHGHGRRAWRQPHYVRPDGRTPAPGAADAQACARRRGGDDRVPGPDPALQPPRHHRRGDDGRQLRLPHDRRRRDERYRQLRQTPRARCRVAPTSCGRKWDIAHQPLRHGEGRRES